MTRSALRMATVYVNPADFPGQVVVRECSVLPGSVVMDEKPAHVGKTIAAARVWCHGRYSTSLPRNAEDEPQILEVWV